MYLQLTLIMNPLFNYNVYKKNINTNIRNWPYFYGFICFLCLQSNVYVKHFF